MNQKIIVDNEMVHGAVGKSTIRFITLTIVLFYLLLAAFWIRKDNTPASWDAAWYLYQGAVQLDSLKADGLSGWYRSWTTLDRTRPSLVSTFTMPFFAAFGVSKASGLIVNCIALLLLCAATYFLAESMESHVAGLISLVV